MAQAPLTSTCDAIGLVGGIPVRNLWLLMLYASSLFRHQCRGKVAIEDSPDDIPDLVAEVLSHIVETRLMRNLTFGYQAERAILGRVRGRIDLLATAAEQLLLRGRVACRFDNLTVNTPRNRYVRGALSAIARLVRRPDLGHRCRALSAALMRLGVSSEMPTRAEIGTWRYGRHDADDRLMVEAAQLALDLCLPTEAAGTRAMVRPDRDPHWARRLYEKAVAGFYDTVLSPMGWRVAAGRSLEWPIDWATSGIEALLPGMRTDIVLTDSQTGRRIVIDTKFTAILTSGWYREESIRSAYLYQIYAYLRSQERSDDPESGCASGLLLHPSLGRMVDETVVIQGHAIRFATVDLAASTAAIREQLLRVTAFPSGVMA